MGVWKIQIYLKAATSKRTHNINEPIEKYNLKIKHHHIPMHRKILFACPYIKKTMNPNPCIKKIDSISQSLQWKIPVLYNPYIEKKTVFPNLYILKKNLFPILYNKKDYIKTYIKNRTLLPNPCMKIKDSTRRRGPHFLIVQIVLIEQFAHKNEKIKLKKPNLT